MLIHSSCEDGKLLTKYYLILMTVLKFFEKFPHKIGLSVLEILIEYACKSQNINSILLARDRIKKIPSKWLLEYLPEVAKHSICIEDEWEYRRLLELVDEAVPQLLEATLSKDYYQITRRFRKRQWILGISR
ncbi:hypothetical protein DOE73_10030 [Paenibacillus dendritiformis]|nr:hypothetical protein DOE73_10030 [Paenibacillus dendritiformis]